MSRRRPATMPKITQPKATPGSVQWVPDYSYECSSGHYLQAEHQLDRCLACHLGEPCTGELHRVGKGSRTVVTA